MFSLFDPKKPIKNQNDPVISPKVPQPVKAKPIKQSLTDYNLRDEVNSVIPAEEMCIGEKPIDTSDIDRMLAEMSDYSSDAKARQMMRMMSVINENLDKNIEVLQSSVDDSTVSREEILKLLQLFANYSRTLENYFKELVLASLR